MISIIFFLTTVAHASWPDESIFQLRSSWKDQNSKSHQLSDFSGKPVVLSLVYLTCKYVCPRIVHTMREIDRNLGEQANQTQFLLVTIDPKNDTSKIMHEFAKRHRLDLNRWTFLSGTEKSTRELAAALGVSYRKDKAGDYSHSTTIYVLDPQGVVRHQQVGVDLNIQETLKNLKVLLAKPSTVKE